MKEFIHSMTKQLCWLNSSRFATFGLSLGILAASPFAGSVLAESSSPAFENAPVRKFLTAQATPERMPVQPLLAQSLSDRWLEVREIKGTVTFNGRPAQVGDRLRTDTDEIVTGKNSTARLAIDNYVGIVEMAEYTSLGIQSLTGTVGVDQVTALSVSRGRVRLSIGRSAGRAPRTALLNEGESFTLASLPGIHGLTNLAQEETPSEEPLPEETTTASASPVRVRTPAGIAGVSGTSFGVDVASNGKTGVNTVDGRVAAAAQGVNVFVDAGFSTVIEPGKAPTTPERSLPLSSLERFHVLKLGPRKVRVTGQVAPQDLVYINDQAIETDGDGKFRVVVNTPASRRLNIVVRGPSVTERHYNLAVP
jgi:hypothetical protein